MQNGDPERYESDNESGGTLLGEWLRRLSRHWKAVFAAALLSGLVTAGTLFLLVPRKYEASATLVIVPPKVSSDLKPPTLTIQGYQKLLESDSVLEETKRRLADRHVPFSQDLFR